MGVIQLWSILSPVKKHVPLSDLKGKTLAVDLSIWVCESNAVRQMQGVVLKPHLRYTLTLNSTCEGIIPVHYTGESFQYFICYMYICEQRYDEKIG